MKSHKEYIPEVTYTPIKDDGKTFDCFIYNGELDILKLRLEELYAKVDTFIIAESAFTFTGQEKPLYFGKHKKELNAFIDKIEYVSSVDKAVYKINNDEADTWARERHTRNLITRGLKRKGIRSQDIIFISDVDEIWRSDVPVPSLYHKHFIVAYQQTPYYYNFNTISNEQWIGTKCIRGYVLKYTTPNAIRYVGKYVQYPFTAVVANAGWHFSYFGGFESIQRKLQSFSHQELVNDQVKDNVFESIEDQKDLFGRPGIELRMSTKQDDDALPQSVLSNPDKWKKHFYTVHQKENDNATS